MVKIRRTSLIISVIVTALIWYINIGRGVMKTVIADVALQERTFVIENNDFLMDGKPFRYISGSLHYFRVVPSSWRDRLRKMKYAGLNTVQTYTLWSAHEPEPGSYDFSDRLDIISFIQIAEEEGLYVILRPGPYICAEVDMGGFPYWLLREDPNMKLRTSDPGYIKFVDKWMAVLLLKIKPFLYQNGGPIIMVQIENEYGSYPACDFEYTVHLRDITKSILGNDVVLFTTDGNAASYLKCGKVAGVYATIDFGTGANINKSFEIQRLFEPKGPFVNSEFYTGWLDHYGEPHNTVNDVVFGLDLNSLLEFGASVNLYLFHGGTSFGMLAGANIKNNNYHSCLTSYDYDAPLNEAGDPTTKYFVIRDVVRNYAPLPPGPVPPASKKLGYGKVNLTPVGNFPEILSHLPIISNKEPQSFEALSIPNGLVAYRTKIKKLTADPSILRFEEVRDRGYVFIGDKYIGIVSREQKILTLGIYAKPNQTLTIIVESMGRLCFGEYINDWKGIGKVTLSNIVLEDWDMIPVPLESMNKITPFLKPLKTVSGMTIYDGKLEIHQNPKDTFIKQDNWTKGYVWINNFLLGRYWPAVGPQMTLYVPGIILRQGINSIRILELEEVDCSGNDSCFIEFVSSPTINGATPYYN